MNQLKIQNSESKIGLCGFINIGNTCYMNSILQLLFHSQLVINFLLYKSNPYIKNNLLNGLDDNKSFDNKSPNNLLNEPEFYEYLKQTIKNKIKQRERIRNKLSENDEIIIDESEIEKYMPNTIIYKLSEIANTIIYKGNSSIKPSSIKNIISKKIPALEGFKQEDSHELLNGLFDIIIEETCVDSEPIINNVPQFINEYNKTVEQLKKKISTETNENQKILINELNNYKKKNKIIMNKYNGLDYMTKIFKTKRVSRDDTSTTGYNPFIFNLLTFTVDYFKCLECSNEDCVYQYQTNLILPLKPTLRECFKMMSNQEHIEKNCKMCKCIRALKKTLIWRPGMTLFIELSRFKNIGEISYKDNMPVEIPHEIDISEFCDCAMKTDKTLNYKYKLKGISNHMGQLNSGHYTADCLSITDNKTWHHYDDSSVSKYMDSNINTSNAYILLYEMNQD